MQSLTAIESAVALRSRANEATNDTQDCTGEVGVPSTKVGRRHDDKHGSDAFEQDEDTIQLSDLRQRST